ncbi:DUF3024 domain-containing protein [Rudaeicoccus suwonensis]|uniref:DUF3024 family protein n=1 Tax=Rudaeicoccus suwonensis TaxID=657409 RepID=A0A561E822_9MICO|nr:DUF3024 domain-containing protein [Rudaeicoccus suwonensis]TWE11763.1 DUF3024 family protein [Rudaeicoccus suwonensis]
MDDNIDQARPSDFREFAKTRSSVDALREWVARRNSASDARWFLLLQEGLGSIVLSENESGSSIPIARFPRTDGYWRLQWMRGSGKWVDYEPGKRYRTLATPMLLIQEDADGCFFG